MKRILLMLYFVIGSFLEITGVDSFYKVHLSPSWYPGKKSDLLQLLSKLDQQAQQQYDAQLDRRNIRAIIVPHAGYEYSGAIACAAYRLLPQRFFKRVIILAPSHYESFEGIGLPHEDYTVYRNIIGLMSLDTAVLDTLATHVDCCFYAQHAHEVDHSINIQLPFIQKYLGKQCLIVPLLIGEMTEEGVMHAASVLTDYIDEHTLVVVSSDFTHYGKRFSYQPFDTNITQHIYELDSKVVKTVQDGSLQDFDAVIAETGATVCGKNALRLLLALMQQGVLGSTESYVVGYDTSASEEVNPHHSVSYVSCVFVHQPFSDVSNEMRLTHYEKQLLLQVSRQCLDSVVISDKIAQDKVGMPGLVTKIMREARGVFVTLSKIGKDGYKQLRGCIGTIFGKKPLYEAVRDMTVAAALHDNRFVPVKKEELHYIDISISVLTRPVDIASYRYIKLGKDGVILTKNEHSAVYLPKVAVEQGWTLTEMLESLSQKAGLSQHSWKDSDVHYQIFESQDFSEDKDPLEIVYEGYKNEKK